MRGYVALNSSHGVVSDNPAEFAPPLPGNMMDPTHPPMTGQDWLKGRSCSSFGFAALMSSGMGNGFAAARRADSDEFASRDRPHGL